MTKQKKSTSNQDNWIEKLDKELTKLGVKQGNFLKGKTGIAVIKKH